MDYQALVKKNVLYAFNKIGTLAELVTFNLKSGNTYNFVTRKVESADTSTITIKGVLLDEQSGGKTPSTTMIKTMMFVSDEVGSPDLYDKALIGGLMWKPVPPFQSDGYITTIKFAKET